MVTEETGFPTRRAGSPPSGSFCKSHSHVALSTASTVPMSQQLLLPTAPQHQLPPHHHFILTPLSPGGPFPNSVFVKISLNVYLFLLGPCLICSGEQGDHGRNGETPGQGGMSRLNAKASCLAGGMQGRVGTQSPATRKGPCVRWLAVSSTEMNQKALKKARLRNAGFNLRRPGQTGEEHRVPARRASSADDSHAWELMNSWLGGQTLPVERTNKRGSCRQVLVLGGEQEEKCEQGYQGSCLPHHLTSVFIHS